MAPRATPLSPALWGVAVLSPFHKMESALAWLCHPPRRSEWGVQPALLTLDPGAARKPLSKEQGLPLLRALLHLLQIFVDSLSFVLSHSGAFQGFPEKPSSITILWEWKAALHLINFPQMLQSHVCFTLPSVPFLCHTMALTALTVAEFE